MKISKIEPIILADRYIIVKVHTDTGIVGIGECSPMNAKVIVAMLKHALEPLIIGEDPVNIEKLWQKMLMHPYKLGPSGAQLEAMAGIDLALWDLLGKEANKPVYELLGGKYRDKIRVYASYDRGRMSPLDMAERAASYVDQGFTAVKVRMGERAHDVDGLPVNLFSVIKEVRSAVGDEIEIMFDANCNLTTHMAIKVGRVLEKYDYFHFEEPVRAHNYPGLKQVADTLDIPVAAGEHEYTKWQFRELLTQTNIDIVQPDLVKAGGITEVQKIAAIGHAFNKPCTLHNTQPTIGTIANLHFCLATPNCLYAQEYNPETNPLRGRILQQGPIFSEGYMIPPTGPGLGIELNEKEVSRLQTN